MKWDLRACRPYQAVPDHRAFRGFLGLLSRQVDPADQVDLLHLDRHRYRADHPVRGRPFRRAIRALRCHLVRLVHRVHRLVRADRARQGCQVDPEVQERSVRPAEVQLVQGVRGYPGTELFLEVSLS